MEQVINVQSANRAAPPWAERHNYFNGSSKSTSGLHYMGWTLVDERGWRWASKDGTNVRIRICREYTSQSEAISSFHERVDRECA